MAIDANIGALFGEPPEGLDLDEDNVWRSDLGLIVLICVAIVSVVLRHAARFLQKAGLKADDYFMIAALGLSVGTSVLVEVAFHAGAGKHVWALRTSQLVRTIQLMWALSINYAAAVWAIKLSILLLYVRLFRVDSRTFRLFVYFGIFATSSLSFAAIVALLLACEPLPYFWAQFDGAAVGYCRLDIRTLYMGIAVINLCLDFYLLALPIPRVLRLQMSPRKKFIVCSSLFLGIAICAAGALRIYYMAAYLASDDPSWDLGPLSLWSSIEPAIGVVTACVPNLLPLYYWVGDRIRSLRYGRSDEGGTSRADLHQPQPFPGALSGRRGATAHDGHHHQHHHHHAHGRLPTYLAEDDLVLRPKEDDEICLTTLATAARGASMDSFHYGNGIVVRSEVTQTVEEGCGKCRSF